MPSQPSHLLSSEPVHSDASRAHRRRTLPAIFQSSMASESFAPMLSGSVYVCGSTSACDANLHLASTAFSSLSNGSANSFTACVTRSSVTFFIEMPAFCERVHGVLAASRSASRLGLRLAVIAERIERLRRHGVHRVRPDQLLHIQHVRVSSDPSCWCWPTARAASARLSSPAHPTSAPEKISL